MFVANKNGRANSSKEVMNFDINYPLVLDLDGTLIQCDLTHELLLRGLLESPVKAV